jgi:membrane protein
MQSSRQDEEQREAGFALVGGLALSIWSASGYVGARLHARVERDLRDTEWRPFWKLRPLQVGVALVLIIAFALLAVSLVMTGPIARAVAGPLGIGGTAVDVWNLAKWPVMILVFIVIISVLYYASPNVKLRGFSWITAGSIVAVIVWIVASALFGLYVANFSSYNETYGTLGGLVALLVWLWISNLAILFGHQLNSERERSLEIEEGQKRAEREIQLEPRSEPKAPKTA